MTNIRDQHVIWEFLMSIVGINLKCLHLSGVQSLLIGILEYFC